MGLLAALGGMAEQGISAIDMFMKEDIEERRMKRLQEFELQKMSIANEYQKDRDIKTEQWNRERDATKLLADVQQDEVKHGYKLKEIEAAKGSSLAKEFEIHQEGRNRILNNTNFADETERQAVLDAWDAGFPNLFGKGAKGAETDPLLAALQANREKSGTPSVVTDLSTAGTSTGTAGEPPAAPPVASYGGGRVQAPPQARAAGLLSRYEEGINQENRDLLTQISKDQGVSGRLRARMMEDQVRRFSPF